MTCHICTELAWPSKCCTMYEFAFSSADNRMQYTVSIIRPCGDLFFVISVVSLSFQGQAVQTDIATFMQVNSDYLLSAFILSCQFYCKAFSSLLILLH
jgi:hypothetical protein